MRNLKLSMIALTLSTLAGCKAIEAMDNTETMKTDLAAMKSTTGGMADTTTGMRSTTEELKRKASVGEGLKLIDSPENQKEFAPPSKGLLAGAKLIAENMTSEELVKFFQAGLKEIRKTAPNTELEGDRAALGGYPARYVFQFNRQKEVQIVTLQAIAAQIPQAMIEKIVQEQLAGPGGAQSDETKDLLMLRAMFISNFFLSESVFATGKKLDNLGKLRNAMQYARQLQYLSQIAAGLGQKDKDVLMQEIESACQSKGDEAAACRDAMLKEETEKQPIKFLVSDAFLPPVQPSERLLNDPECMKDPAQAACQPTLGQARVYSEMLELKIAKPWFEKIAKRIDKDMPESLRGGASPYAYEIAQIKEECRRY